MKFFLVFFLTLSACRLHAGPLIVTNEDPGLTAAVDPARMTLLGLIPQEKTKAILPNLELVIQSYPDVVSLMTQALPPASWQIPNDIPEISSSWAIEWDHGSVLMGFLSKGQGWIRRYAMDSGKTLGEISLQGIPKSILATSSCVYVTVELPNATPTGMLYQFNPSLDTLEASLPLQGRPWTLALALTAADQANSQTQVQRPSPTPQNTPTGQAGSLVTPSSPLAMFHTTLYGKVQDAQTHEAVSGITSVYAENNRGIRFPGTVTPGSYSIESLPWGSYTVTLQAQGYQTRIYSGIRIAWKRTKELDLELEPLPAQGN